MNDSFVFDNTFDELALRLDAILLWTARDGFNELFRDWVFEVGAMVDFTASALPDQSVSVMSWQYLVKRAESAALPIAPFIGDTVERATAMITDVAKRMVLSPADVGQRGSARTGWTVNLTSEYDCQNLFFTVVKPWLVSVGREELTISYDDQKKSADFSFFDGQLIVELKFIDSNAKKAEVVKTLDGLSRFYVRNGNVRILLMLVFVKTGTDVDAPRWAHDYTFYGNVPRVLTHVIYVP